MYHIKPNCNHYQRSIMFLQIRQVCRVNVHNYCFSEGTLRTFIRCLQSRRL